MWTSPDWDCDAQTSSEREMSDLGVSSKPIQFPWHVGLSCVCS